MSLDLSLYLVTDPRLCARYGLVETVVAAVRGGVTIVQLRDKQASDGELIDQARQLKAALAGSGVPLIINDHLTVALESGSDGLHLGQGDGDVVAARAAMGEQSILGLSVQNHAQLAELDAALPDYLGLGPVFVASTKDDRAKPLASAGV